MIGKGQTLPLENRDIINVQKLTFRFQVVGVTKTKDNDVVKRVLTNKYKQIS